MDLAPPAQARARLLDLLHERRDLARPVSRSWWAMYPMRCWDFFVL